MWWYSIFAIAVSVSGAPVLELTEKNMDSAIKEHSHVLVNFYDGNEQSLILATAFPNVSLSAEEKEVPIVIAQYDCSSVKTHDRQDLHGVLYENKPVLRLFQYGRLSGDYAPSFPWNDTQTVKDIVDFSRLKTQYPCDIIEDVEEARTFIEDDQAVVLAFVSDAGTSLVAKALCENVAPSMNADATIVPMAVTSCPEVAAAHGIDLAAGDALAVLTRFSGRAGEEQRHTLDGAAAADPRMVRRFVERHHLPSTTLYTKKTSAGVFQVGGTLAHSSPTHTNGRGGCASRR
jgi:hypothetical protein